MDDVTRVSTAGFDPQSADKVHRLVAVLSRINGHPALRGAVALHGGTALNLFYLGLPRLSVDIDLAYIGSTDRSAMQEDRPKIEKAIADIGKSLGYNIGVGAKTDSGGAFTFQYGTSSDEHIKVDVNYRYRSPLLPVANLSIALDNGLAATFPVRHEVEVVASKLQALVDRVAARDLYDVTQLAKRKTSHCDDLLSRRVTLYHLAITDRFPHQFSLRDRFENRDDLVRQDLHPMLEVSDRPSLEQMVTIAERYLERAATAHDQQEADFLTAMAEGAFDPGILFADYPDVLAAAKADPSALWKMRNLAPAIRNEIVRPRRFTVGASMGACATKGGGAVQVGIGAVDDSEPDVSLPELTQDRDVNLGFE